MERAALPVWRMLPAKLATLLACFALMVTVIGGIIVLGRIRAFQLAAMEDHARGAARTLAAWVGPALEFDAVEDGERSMRAILADGAVEGVVVVDQQGQVWAEAGKIASAIGPVSSSAQVSSLSGQPLGFVRVVMSPDALAVHAQAARVGLASVFVLVCVGLALVVISVRRLTAPLLKVATAAQQLAQGEVGAPLALGRPGNDEIGLAAAAFERMHVRLRALYEAQQRVAAGNFSNVCMGDGALFSGFQAIVASSSSVENATRKDASSSNRQSNRPTKQTP